MGKITRGGMRKGKTEGGKDKDVNKERQRAVCRRGGTSRLHVNNQSDNKSGLPVPLDNTWSAPRQQ